MRDTFFPRIENRIYLTNCFHRIAGQRRDPIPHFYSMQLIRITFISTVDVVEFVEKKKNLYRINLPYLVQKKVYFIYFYTNWTNARRIMGATVSGDNLKRGGKKKKSNLGDNTRLIPYRSPYRSARPRRIIHFERRLVSERRRRRSYRGKRVGRSIEKSDSRMQISTGIFMRAVKLLRTALTCRSRAEFEILKRPSLRATRRNIHNLALEN